MSKPGSHSARRVNGNRASTDATLNFASTTFGNKINLNFYFFAFAFTVLFYIFWVGMAFNKLIENYFDIYIVLEKKWNSFCWLFIKWCFAGTLILAKTFLFKQRLEKLYL